MPNLAKPMCSPGEIAEHLSLLIANCGMKAADGPRMKWRILRCPISHSVRCNRGRNTSAMRTLLSWPDTAAKSQSWQPFASTIIWVTDDIWRCQEQNWVVHVVPHWFWSSCFIASKTWIEGWNMVKPHRSSSISIIVPWFMRFSMISRSSAELQKLGFCEGNLSARDLTAFCGFRKQFWRGNLDQFVYIFGSLW